MKDISPFFEIIISWRTFFLSFSCFLLPIFVYCSGMEELQTFLEIPISSAFFGDEAFFLQACWIPKRSRLLYFELTWLLDTDVFLLSLSHSQKPPALGFWSSSPWKCFLFPSLYICFIFIANFNAKVGICSHISDLHWVCLMRTCACL